MDLKERRHDIDWLRVIAFYILIFFHVGMVFVPWSFHIKNPTTAKWFETWMAFLSEWRLPLLFLISGIGVCYALGKRSPNQFMAERTKRLLIPLLLGIFVIVPPQIYFERILNGVHFDSYFDFWKTVFNFVPYPAGGSLSWHHLWFIVYILVYSFAMLPLFLYLRGSRGEKFRKKTSLLFSKHPNAIYLLFLPLFAVYFFLAPLFPTTHALWGDWYNIIYSLLFFTAGFLISITEGLWEIIAAKRMQSLIISLFPALILILFVWGPTFHIVEGDTYIFFFFYSMLKTIMAVALVFAILGYGKTYLNKPGKFLNYANESVYPLYVLHQTILITLGYFVIKFDWAIMPKFFLLIAGTFGLSFAVYEIFIRRFNLMRLLFGMKPKKNKNGKEALPGQIALEKED